MIACWQGWSVQSAEQALARTSKSRAACCMPTGAVLCRAHCLDSCPAASWGWPAGLSPGLQRDALAKPVDLIIGTPQKVAQHAESGNLFYGDVQVPRCWRSVQLPGLETTSAGPELAWQGCAACMLRSDQRWGQHALACAEQGVHRVQLVVLDEADTLLEKGFKGEVEAVLKPLRSKSQPASVTLVVATFTKVGCPTLRLPGCAADTAPPAVRQHKCILAALAWLSAWLCTMAGRPHHRQQQTPHHRNIHCTVAKAWQGQTSPAGRRQPRASRRSCAEC